MIMAAGIPIRCFSCGKLIADKWEEFNERLEQGEEAREILDDLGFTRYCCRRMLLSHRNLIDDTMQFSI